MVLSYCHRLLTSCCSLHIPKNQTFNVNLQAILFSEWSGILDAVDGATENIILFLTI